MISWDRIRELKDEVGDDDFAEVVELFLDEVEEVLARLKDAPDPATYEADLHFLKGSALNLGFRALSTLCQDRERRIATDPAGDPDMGELISTYEKSKAEFLSAA